MCRLLSLASFSQGTRGARAAPDWNNLCPQAEIAAAKAIAGKKSLALEKVRISADSGMAKATCEELQKKVKAESEQVELEIDTAIVDHAFSADSIKDLKEELRTTQTELTGLLQSKLESMAALSSRIQNASTFVMLYAAHAEVKLISQSATKSKQLTAFARGVREVRGLMKDFIRKKGVAGQSEAAAEQILRAHPVHQALHQIVNGTDGNAINCANSIFEAKAGVRAAVLTCQRGDPSGSISKNAFVKRAKKELATLLKNEDWGVSLIMPADQKKIVKAFRPCYDEGIFAERKIPSSLDWCEKVYCKQFFSLRAGAVQIGFPHFGSMEARVLLEGSEVVAGILYDKAPGANMREKRAHLFSANETEINRLVADGGWVAWHEDKVLVVPAGYICITAGDDQFGIRWSLSADAADQHRVQAALTRTVESFPEMKNPSLGIAQFNDWLADTDA